MCNVQGIGSKLRVINDVNNVNNVNMVCDISSDVIKADIVILVETWLSKASTIQVQGYTNDPHYNVYRPKHIKAKRCSGGISLLIKNSIIKFVTVVKQNEFSLWLKVNGVAFGMTRDIYISGVYIPPVKSVFLNKDLDPFHKLEDDFAYFQSKGHVVSMGDFNARISNKQDIHYNIHNFDMMTDDIIKLPQRNSRDSTLNTFGGKFLNVCNSSGMIILNGRANGDTMGNFTSFQTNGCSVIVYSLYSEDILDKVDHMIVGAPNQFSDHAMLSLQLNTPLIPEQLQTKVKLKTIPISYKWDRLSQSTFRANLRSQHFQSMTCIENIPMKGVDECAKVISEALTNVADCCLNKTIKRSSNSKSNSKHKWHNPHIAHIERDLKWLGKMVKNDPHNNEHRRHFNELKSMYKKKIKSQNRQHKTFLYERILECDHSNPKEFWSIVKQLKGAKKSDTLDPDIFFDHFKKLNSNRSLPSDHIDKLFENQVQNKLSDFKLRQNAVPALDSAIEIDELHSTIRKLPNRKAVGLDGVMNEMIKTATQELSGPLLFLFNRILSESVFPAIWAQGMIVPIHKSGSLKDPNNYRGICISSCLGKLFTKLMANRLTNWLLNTNRLSEYQIGFRPQSRTSDHVFVLKSIIDHMKKHRKKVFACFIDFRKAFDSIWRDGLLYKLHKWGLGTKFCSMMTNMFSRLTSCVKIDNKITEFFLSEKGTRQGCNLSPMIFNLFINELPSLLLKINSDPILIEGKEVPILMYADDVVLLSKSTQGLNRALNVLHVFCQKWKLQINTSKTKVLIFNCRKWDNFKFFMGNNQIAIKDNYTYLGYVVSPSGRFTSCIKNLAMKAKKAYNSFRFKMSPQTGCPINVLMKLFNSLVTPIALYGAEVWGLADVNSRKNNLLQHLLTVKDIHSQLLNSFCKSTLQVNSKANNIASRRELGIWPFMIPILKASFKFYMRTKYSDHNSLLNHAFRSQLNIEHSSISNLRSIVQVLNCNDHITADMRNKPVIKSLAQDLVNKLRFTYEHLSDLHISKCSRLSLLYQVLGPYKQPKYINFIRNPVLRGALTRWRLSCHALPIERGRYSGITRLERLCTKCNLGKVGDELHALFICNDVVIKSLRDKYLTKIICISNQFPMLSDKDKLLYMLRSHDHDILPNLCEWFKKINDAYKC